MADVGIPRKDADGRQQRAKTAAASVDSRKCRSDHAVGSDGDDNDTASGRHAGNTSISDGEQPRDARRTINRSSSVAAIESDPNAPLRLIVVSSKIRNTSVMHAAVLPHVVFVQYKYESATVDSCLGKFLRSDCYMFDLLPVVKVVAELSQTSLVPLVLLILAGMLFCCLLCQGIGSQLSIFVMLYALQSFLIKLWFRP